jgi:ATP-dependent RNA helicase DeaD
MKLRGGRRTRSTRNRRKRDLIRRISRKGGKTVRSVSRRLGKITGRVPIVGNTSKKVFNLFGREGKGLISIAGDTLDRGTKIITSPLKRLLSMGTRRSKRSRRSRGSKRSKRSRRSRGSKRSKRSRRSRGSKRSRR